MLWREKKTAQRYTLRFVKVSFAFLEVNKLSRITAQPQTKE